jgi:biotin operon repressor
MTIAPFDAPASTTPQRTAGSYPRIVDPNARKIVRAVWLTALLVRRQRVTLQDYRNRFGVSLRSFRRDIATIRDAGLYLDADPDDGYRFICFRPDSDAS